MKKPHQRREAGDPTRRTNCYIAVIMMILVVSAASTVAIVSGQDIHSDRYSIQVVLVSGNDKALGGNENFSSLKLMLGETNPDTGLGLNLTVSGELSSETDLGSAKLLIIIMPSYATIPNSTIIQHFLNTGGSLFLLSDYYGGGAINSSLFLNNILNETSISNVAFENDAISISNSSPNWQARTYGNNTFAVRVNSSMFQLVQSSQSVVGGLTDIVTLSCSLNVTNHNDPTFVGIASAQSDSGLPNWLLLVDDGTHRSVLCGSASMFNNTYLNSENNQALLSNLILWLVQNFQVFPPDVFGYMALVSLAIIVVGIAIYVAYRKRRTMA
jgi:hypothetical protein